MHNNSHEHTRQTMHNDAYKREYLYVDYDRLVVCRGVHC